MDVGQLALLGPRQMRNCLPCKKRKIKCDRKIPCGPCALRHDVKNCTPAFTKLENVDVDLESYVSMKDFKALAQHVQSLEDKLNDLQAGLGGGRIDRPDGGDNSDAASDAGSISSPINTAPITSRRHVGDDEMVFALEDFHMSHRINTIRNLGESLDSAGNAAELMEAGLPPDMQDEHPLSFLLPQPTQYLEKALAVLPDTQTCKILVARYFESVEWFQRCLHYPSFMAHCEEVWGERQITKLSPDFVACYLMVICLALRSNFDPLPHLGNVNALAKRLFHVAEGVLWCSQFMTRQSFESLQAITLMTIYGYGMEGWSDAMWALSGAAIKIAQNLGLNRLDAERPGRVWSPMWNTLLKREMGRRVWWTFVFLDWSHAAQHGSTYCIHPAQNLTVFPGNLNDDELDNDSAAAHPLSVYTDANMHIFRFKFVTLYREITDHMASHATPSYTYILHMDKRIIELASALPAHFDDPEHLPDDTNPAIIIDSIFINIMANTRLTRLHRSFFLRGYHDMRYATSKDRCVEASLNILRLIDLATRRAPAILNFWVVLFYAFSGAVPVCIDTLFNPTEEKRDAVRRCIETFSAIFPAARKSVYVLDRLMDAEDLFRRPDVDEPQSAKRPRLSFGSGPLSPSTSRQVDVLKSTVHSILQSGEFDSHRRATAERPVDPAVLQQGLMLDFGAAVPTSELAGPMWVDRGDDMGVNLEALWPGGSLDALWTMTESAWVNQ